MDARTLWFIAGATLVLMALLSPLSRIWEAHLVTHLLVQYPLLIGAGSMAGAALARTRNARWTAASALLGAGLALGFWLLPRSIDAALAAHLPDMVKAGCLVVLVGLPLGWGWTQAGPILRGFTWANAIAMLIVMGWLQLAVPVRLCNRYLLGDQRQLGLALLALAALMLAAGLGRVMLGRRGARPDPSSGPVAANSGPSTGKHAASSLKTGGNAGH